MTDQPAGLRKTITLRHAVALYVSSVLGSEVLVLPGLSLLMLLVYYVLDVDLKTALLIPSGAAVLVYVIGSASGIKLLNRPARRTPRP